LSYVHIPEVMSHAGNPLRSVLQPEETSMSLRYRYNHLYRTEQNIRLFRQCENVNCNGKNTFNFR